MNNSLREKRVLITGASGFIGSWLTQKLLEQQATVTALLHEWNPDSYFISSGMIHRVQNVVGVVEDYDLLEKTIGDYGINTVLHLAAVSVQGQAMKKPREALETNIRGTYNILEACRVHAHLIERVIVTSSDKAYGDSNILPYLETLPMQGKHPYDVSKSCADLIARCYHHSYGLPVAVVRLANTYGGGDWNWSRLIPKTILSLLNNEPPLIYVPLKGDFKRDFLYVEDLVNGYMAVLEGLANPEIQGEAFNLGTGYCWTVMDIVNKIKQQMNYEHIEPVIVQKPHGEILHQSLSPEKAKTILGWTPHYNLDEGLAKTIDWYKAWWRSSKSGHLG